MPHNPRASRSAAPNGARCAMDGAAGSRIPFYGVTSVALLNGIVVVPDEIFTELAL